MRVREWMSPDPVTVTPSTDVAEARRLLDRYGVRHLPVVEHGRVVGMISDRDVRVSPAALRQVTERLAATGRAAVAEDAGVGLVVSAVMSAPVHVVTVDEDVDAAARLLLSRRISALPVLDDGALVGLITSTDCLLASPYTSSRDRAGEGAERVMTAADPRTPGLIDEAPPARWLFASTGVAPLVWLVARLWLGYEWLAAGWDKATGGGWLDGGAALRGFAANAVETGAAGDHPQVAYGWYVVFLEWIRDSAHVWMAPMVAIGQLVIGILLLAGAFVGVAAFLGVVLNFSFVFAGSAGVNPLFLIIGLLLMLAWRNGGWYGADRWLLPWLGTPWLRPSAGLTGTGKRGAVP
jgi:thiosulfate dehydrogenase [quinone] large subunit